MIHHFYVEKSLRPGIPAALTHEDAHHARDVLRLASGDDIELIADGQRFSARISSVTPSAVTAVVSTSLPSVEPRLSLTLFQGLPKGDKMEWIIQKAVEIGVSRIVPVRMSRCVVRLKDQEAVRKTERWQRIAREAGKQSGRCILPQVEAPVSLCDLPARLSSLEAVALPWEDWDHGGPQSFAARHPSLASLGIIIGPEGGITPEEVEFLRNAGADTLTLGPRILRTETAGLAAAAAFLSLYGEME